MEIKINHEIKDYTESIFFGLSARQFIYSLLACAAAIGLYFGLRGRVGTEPLSWICMLGAAPFAALGFIKYHGMTAGVLLRTWFRSEMLMPRYLVFKANTNIETEERDN